MKNSISVSAQSEKSSLRASFQSWLRKGNGLFSLLMDDYITNRQAILFCNALLAFASLLCFACSHPAVVLFIVLWLLWSISLCEKGGIK